MADKETPRRFPDDPVDGTEQGPEIGPDYLKWLWAMQQNERTVQRIMDREAGK